MFPIQRMICLQLGFLSLLLSLRWKRVLTSTSVCLFVAFKIFVTWISFFFSFFFLRGLDLSLAWPLLLPCLYLPNQTSQFCFSSQLLFAQAEKSRWQRLRHTLANMSALTRTHKFSNLHAHRQKHTYFHGFYHYFLFSLSLPIKSPKQPLFW